MGPFVGVQFTEEENFRIAIVHEKWLTPKKTETFWPPSKFQSDSDRALRKGLQPQEGEGWKLYPIAKCYFECGKC